MLANEGLTNIYSHNIAVLAGRTPAQVRRDFMVIGYNGTPAYGYKIDKLLESIENFINPTGIIHYAIIVGIGNLGRAILDYCFRNPSSVEIVSAFDKDPMKIDRVIHRTKCYHISKLPEIVSSNNIKIGVITVTAEEAQNVADMMVSSGINSILNFTPRRLKVPENVYVENLDMLISLEKAGYFAYNR